MKKAIQISILLLCFFVCVSVLYLIVNQDVCSITRTPSMKSLRSGINKKYELKNSPLRIMARRIYEYRVAIEYPKITIRNIYSVLGRTNNIPKSDLVNDLTLYKVSIAKNDEELYNLIQMIHVMTHPDYIKLIESYDPTKKVFKDIDNESSKTIIIRDILNLYDLRNSDIRSNIKQRLANMLPNNMIDQLDKMTSETMNKIDSDEWLYLFITCNLKSNSFE